MNAPKNKGDAAEREAAALINALTGWPVRRKLGAGRTDDCGDLDGVPSTTVQVKSFRDVQRGIREALADLEAQRVNAGTPFAFAMVRRPGGRWVIVMEPEHVCTLLREATS